MPADVVDGQQRLVTLTLILALLRDALPPGKSQSDLQSHLERPSHSLLGHATSPRIMLHVPYRADFEIWTQQVGATNRLPSESSTESTRQLLAVLKALRDEIHSYDVSSIEKLSRVILNQTFVVLLSATTLDDAYLLFRSVNTPGLPLSPLDLTKVELPDAHKLADAWMNAEEELGEEKLEQYVNTVLRLVDPSHDGRDLRAGLRKLMLDSKRLVAFRARLEGFIQNYASFDSATLDFGSSSDEVNRIVACFQGLPFDDWRPTVLIWLSSGPLSGTYSNAPPAKKTADFFRLLNALCIGFVILGTRPAKRAVRFERINARINEGKDIFALDSELLLTPGERNSVRDRLKGPLTEKARYLKALLLRINAEMLPIEIPPYFPDNITIEHVLPQNPSRGSQWVRDFPNAKRRKELCYLLGNLTILTHPANSTVGNCDFRAKKDGLFGVKGNQSFAMNTEIVRRDAWTEPAILERQEAMLNLADRVMRL